MDLPVELRKLRQELEQLDLVAPSGDPAIPSRYLVGTADNVRTKWKYADTK